jgi:uncharacterized protein YbaP (TraB family)
LALVMKMIYAMADSDSGTQLDLYLARQAHELEMEYGGLESFEEQLRSFEEKTPEELAESLQRFMKEASALLEGGRFVEPIFYVYLKGSEAGFRDMILSSLGHTYAVEGFFGRNRMMAARIDKAMRAAPDKRFFFSCGAGHCIGACSVPDLLRLMGWEVERLE